MRKNETTVYNLFPVLFPQQVKRSPRPNCQFARLPKSNMLLSLFLFLSFCGIAFGRVVLQSWTETYDEANKNLFEDLKVISVGQHFDFCTFKEQSIG